MKLDLKESNSPFCLLGLSKGKSTIGSATNIPCYYKTAKKQYEIASRIINEPGIDEVYLITGIEWDNMKGSWSAKESGSYIQNKGKLIASKNEFTKYDELYGKTDITENDYPKGVSRDPLPKRGVKTYTSVATALEDKGDDKMKLELKNVSEGSTKQFLKVGDTFKNAGSIWKVLKQNDEDTLLVALDKDNNETNRFVVAWGLQNDNSWNQGHYFTDKERAEKYFDDRSSKNLNEDIDDIPEMLQDRFFTAMGNGSPEEFKKFSKEELVQFATFVKELPEYEVTDLERSLLLYAISMAHGDDLTVDDQSTNGEIVTESKIVSPVGNPQTAGSFVNIDVDLDHMEISDFIVRLAQAIRSEQTSVLEYVALRSANGVTNEDRSNIDLIIEEEKNHMAAFTTLLYKQILTNHKQNVDGANNEFVLPKFGTDLLGEDNKLKESVSNTLDKILIEGIGVRMSDEFYIGNRDDGRMYHGLSNAMDVIKNIISTSGEEVVVQNATLNDELTENKQIIKESMSVDEFIKELETDTNYDEIAYHIHEFSKTDKNKALELMDKLFDIENSKSPKECVQEIISMIKVEEDINIKNDSSKNEYNILVDVNYDEDFRMQVENNLTNAVENINKELKNDGCEIVRCQLVKNQVEIVLNNDETFTKEVNESFVEDLCKKLFDKATTAQYFISLA